MLHFFHHPLSPYSIKVHFLLEEAGRPYELATVALEKGEQRNADFRSKNPFGRVPTITDHGFSLAESGAILRYLARKWELYDVYPLHLEEAALVDMWTEFLAHHVTKPLVDLAWHRAVLPKSGRQGDEHTILAAEERLKRELPIVERHLESRHWFAGANLTLADITLAPFAVLAESGGVHLRDFPAILAWRERVTKRPAWQRLSAR